MEPAVHTSFFSLGRRSTGWRKPWRNGTARRHRHCPAAPTRPSAGGGFGFPRELLIFRQWRQRWSLLKSWPRGERQGLGKRSSGAVASPIAVWGQELALCLWLSFPVSLWGRRRLASSAGGWGSSITSSKGTAQNSDWQQRSKDGRVNSLIWESAKAGYGRWEQTQNADLAGSHFGLERWLLGAPNLPHCQCVLWSGIRPLRLLWPRSQTPQLPFQLCPLCMPGPSRVANQKVHRLWRGHLEEAQTKAQTLPKGKHWNSMVLWSFSYLLSLSSFLFFKFNQCWLFFPILNIKKKINQKM